MPWPGLLPADKLEHANEMGTSELHRTSIMLAAARWPRTEACTRGDHNRRPQPQNGDESHLAIAALGRPGPSVENSLTQTAPFPKSGA